MGRHLTDLDKQLSQQVKVHAAARDMQKQDLLDIIVRGWLAGRSYDDPVHHQSKNQNDAIESSGDGGFLERLITGLSHEASSLALELEKEHPAVFGENVLIVLRDVAEHSNQFKVYGLCRVIADRADKLCERMWDLDARRNEELDQISWEGREWVSATDVGRRLTTKLRGVEVNKLLAQGGYMVKSPEGWRLAAKGDGLGEECQTTAGKTYVRWRRGILEILEAILST